MKYIVVAATIAVAAGLAACGGPYELTAFEKQTAELGALKFAAAAVMVPVSVSGQDSDRDGYVTATLKDSTGALVEIVCSYRQESGCKKK